MTKSYPFFLGLLTALSVASFSFNARAEGDEEGPEVALSDRPFKDLNLSDEQKKKIAEIRKAYKDQIPPLRKVVKEKRETLKNTMQSEVSAAEATKIFDELQAQQQKVHSLMFEQMLKIREVLTVDQRKKAGKFLDAHFKKMRRHGK